MLRPRESRELRLISSQITVTPDPLLTWAHDVFGNAVVTATFQMTATDLVIASAAKLQLDAVAWPVFDIAFSALSYPFRYSDDDWIDLGALAAPQFADAAGIYETGCKCLFGEPRLIRYRYLRTWLWRFGSCPISDP